MCRAELASSEFPVYRLALPHWARKKPRVFLFKDYPENHFEIRLKNEKLGAPKVQTPAQLFQKLREKLSFSIAQ